MAEGSKKLTIRIKTPANFVLVETEDSPIATPSEDSGPTGLHEDDESSSLGDKEEAVFGM